MGGVAHGKQRITTQSSWLDSLQRQCPSWCIVCSPPRVQNLFVRRPTWALVGLVKSSTPTCKTLCKYHAWEFMRHIMKPVSWSKASTVQSFKKLFVFTICSSRLSIICLQRFPRTESRYKPTKWADSNSWSSPSYASDCVLSTECYHSW